MSTPLAIGGHVLIITDDGSRFLGQITEAGVSATETTRVVAGGGTLIAKEAPGGWLPVALTDVFEIADMDVAPPDLVTAWLTTAIGDTGVLEHGTSGPGGQPVRLRAAGFSRHTFLCGQSGSGKTYAMGRLLEQLLLETELQMIVLDPNSDYVRLSELGLPSDDPDAARVAELAGRICVFRAGKGTFRLRVRFGRFPLTMQALVLAMDPLRDAEEYDVLRRLTEEMGTTEYSLRDLRDRLDVDHDPGQRRLALRIDNLGVLAWSIWAEKDQPPLLDQLPRDWRAAVIDLGELESAPERSAVAAAILSGIWRRRHERQPVLLVIDEAHNVCPQEPTDHNQALAVEQAINIAAEGRKFGIYLLLATQRPQKLHANVLTQCENLILMRMNSQADIAHLAAVFSHVPRSLIEQAAGFELGEGLVAGRIAPFPSLFRTGPRRSPEGGSDVPTTWAGRAPVPAQRPG
jgi:DNA helicase HerA-like ATPase